MPDLTTPQTAKLLGISESRVKQLCQSGALPAVSEPWGPGTRWLVDRAAVLARKRAKRNGKLSKGGRGIKAR